MLQAISPVGSLNSSISAPEMRILSNVSSPSGSSGYTGSMNSSGLLSQSPFGGSLASAGSPIASPQGLQQQSPFGGSLASTGSPWPSPIGLQQQSPFAGSLASTGSPWPSPIGLQQQSPYAGSLASTGSPFPSPQLISPQGAGLMQQSPVNLSFSSIGSSPVGSPVAPMDPVMARRLEILNRIRNAPDIVIPNYSYSSSDGTASVGSPARYTPVAMSPIQMGIPPISPASVASSFSCPAMPNVSGQSGLFDQSMMSGSSSGASGAYHIRPPQGLDNMSPYSGSFASTGSGLSNLPPTPPGLFQESPYGGSYASSVSTQPGLLQQSPVNLSWSSGSSVQNGCPVAAAAMDPVMARRLEILNRIRNAPDIVIPNYTYSSPDGSLISAGSPARYSPVAMSPIMQMAQQQVSPACVASSFSCPALPNFSGESGLFDQSMMSGSSSGASGAYHIRPPQGLDNMSPYSGSFASTGSGLSNLPQTPPGLFQESPYDGSYASSLMSTPPGLLQQSPVNLSWSSGSSPCCAIQNGSPVAAPMDPVMARRLEILNRIRNAPEPVFSNFNAGSPNSSGNGSFALPQVQMMSPMSNASSGQPIMDNSFGYNPARQMVVNNNSPVRPCSAPSPRGIMDMSAYSGSLASSNMSSMSGQSGGLFQQSPQNLSFASSSSDNGMLGGSCGSPNNLNNSGGSGPLNISGSPGLFQQSPNFDSGSSGIGSVDSPMGIGNQSPPSFLNGSGLSP